MADMPDQWESMIPFYVAGTLPKVDAARLEKHLTQNAEARRSLDEWRKIAAAVRADAASQLRDLPPLSARVTGAMHQQAAGRQFQSYAASRSATRTRTTTTSITLVAALFTVIVFGGLLIALLRGTLPQETNPSVALLPSETPTLSTSETPMIGSETPTPNQQPQIIIIEPSATPITPSPTATRIVPTIRPSATRTPQTFTAILPPTVIIPQATPTPEAIGMGGGSDTIMMMAGCTVSVAIPNGVVNLYAERNGRSPILATFRQDDVLTALARSDDGWIQADFTTATNTWVGWVRQEQVYLSGDCDALPVIPGEPTPAPTATHTALPFETGSAATGMP